MKRFETEISMTLKMTVYVIAHDRADAERKISRITRNNGEDPDNDFLGMVELSCASLMLLSCAVARAFNRLLGSSAHETCRCGRSHRGAG